MRGLMKLNFAPINRFNIADKGSKIVDEGKNCAAIIGSIYAILVAVNSFLRSSNICENAPKKICQNLAMLFWMNVWEELPEWA